jgi:hypothetical protein
MAIILVLTSLKGKIINLKGDPCQAKNMAVAMPDGRPLALGKNRVPHASRFFEACGF